MGWECRFIETDDKVALVDELSDLGYAKVEVTSFTSAQAIPALRDAEAVMQRIRRRPGVVYTALVPNVRGGERALECRTDEFNLVMSASETHNLANLRMTREQSVDRFAEAGAVGVTLCDTTGMAFPTQVQAMCEQAVSRYPSLNVTAHFHNTRAMGW